MSALIFEAFLSTPEMLEVFGEGPVVQAMLDFESALSRAQAEVGLMPLSAGKVIASACEVGRFDVPAIVAQSGRAGTLAIPLVKALTETVRELDASAAGYVHWGSTSQDVIDTGMALVTRRALALIDRDLGVLIDALLHLAEAHVDTPILARTLMQPAQVVSFGFKLVAWVAPLVRRRARLKEAAGRALQLQFGGAVGTRGVLGEQGDAVARLVAKDLQLALPMAAWHTQRDDWVSLGAEVGVLCGALGKVARDIALLAQGEIAEVAEPSGGGRGGSSAMPHKRNPVASMLALAAALRAPQRVAALLAAMPQEHERGMGNWQAELAEWAELFLSAHGSLKALADMAGGLQVDTRRMLHNIDALQGLVFAEAVSMHFAKHVGKAKAHSTFEKLSQQVVAEGRHLQQVTADAMAQDQVLRDAFHGDVLTELFSAAKAAEPAARLARLQLEALRNA